MCWLADVDKLYDVALGMYDFELVMLVAQKSQKVLAKPAYLSASGSKGIYPLLSRATTDGTLLSEIHHR